MHRHSQPNSQHEKTHTKQSDCSQERTQHTHRPKPKQTLVTTGHMTVYDCTTVVHNTTQCSHITWWRWVKIIAAYRWNKSVGLVQESDKHCCEY